MKRGAGAAVLAVSLAYGALPASAYTNLFAFGDSFGRGQSYFKLREAPSPYVMGHASNGPTWVEDRSSLRRTPLPSNSLTPGRPKDSSVRVYASGAMGLCSFPDDRK
jgi:hypothetical protein